MVWCLSSLLSSFIFLISLFFVICSSSFIHFSSRGIEISWNKFFLLVVFNSFYFTSQLSFTLVLFFYSIKDKNIQFSTHDGACELYAVVMEFEEKLLCELMKKPQNKFWFTFCEINCWCLLCVYFSDMIW